MAVRSKCKGPNNGNETQVKGNTSNAEYINCNPIFVKACELAGIPATKRQASKYRAGRGLAYSFKNEAKNAKTD